jgi:hypothetical protein
VAEESTEAATDVLTGFEKYDVETLLKVRQNLIGGINQVGERMEFDGNEIVGMGTALIRSKEGAATPAEAGQVIVMLFDTVTLELRKRGVLK